LVERAASEGRRRQRAVGPAAPQRNRVRTLGKPWHERKPGGACERCRRSSALSRPPAAGRRAGGPFHLVGPAP